jgi:CubicO group peptidase (beta-lactamase class C family)
MTAVQGTCDPRFEEMRQILQRNLDSGDDLGASVCVNLNGQTVVDLWGGWADEAKTKPWERDTIVNVWSTTKTMTSLAALVLADRGELDVYAPVARYWPEFAQNGKGDIRVRHLMSHTSGVSAWEKPVTTEDIYDWEKATAMLARQAPWWEPGTASGYHALNQGHLVGEVVRRITGKSLGTFFRDEIAKPLGADFHIGLDPKHDARVSFVIPPEVLPVDMSAMDPNSPAIKTFTGPNLDATLPRTEAWRRAEIGAANGHGNARSVVRCQSVVANDGEMDGVRLLSPKTIDLIFDEQCNGTDLVLGAPARFGIGYGLPNASFPHIPADARACFWGGWGGSTAVVDVGRHLTVSYVMNRMYPGALGDTRGMDLTTAAYRAIGVG